MAVTATFDLGWPVARLKPSLDILEIWTPTEYDPYQIFKKDAQFICIQGKENLEKLRMFLEQYYPSEGGEGERG